MMEFDRYEGESLTLVLGEHVIRISLIKTGKDRARLGIDAPTGAIMFRSENLAQPIGPVEIAEPVPSQTARST